MPSRLFLVYVYAQNIQAELAILFPGIRFWRTYRQVELTSNVLELIIPNQCAMQQGYSISADQDCQVNLTFCIYVHVSDSTVQHDSILYLGMAQEISNYHSDALAEWWPK